MNHLSLMVNLILLAGIGVAIYYLIKTKTAEDMPAITENNVQSKGHDINSDEIISVRKISWDEEPAMDVLNSRASLAKSLEECKTLDQYNRAPKIISPKKILFIITANNEEYFAGYELLQILLSAGLRFGEGQLFHRHQQANGAGDVCFSIAAATSSGTFDLQNIGSLKMRGLCIFMQLTDNSDWNKVCFELMIDTAKKLAHELKANLLDDHNTAIDDAALELYRQNFVI